MWQQKIMLCIITLSLLATLLYLVVFQFISMEEHALPEDIIKCDSSQGYLACKEPGKDYGIPIILWWTPLFYPHIIGKYLQCGDVSCYATNNRSLVKSPHTRGFVFYGTGIDGEDLPLPRLPSHEWALYHEESPLNDYMLSHEAFIELFNHTATFRNESDFPLTSHYIYHVNYLTERRPVSLKVKNEVKAKEKLAPMLYVQSNCQVPSDRDRYVEELMKYIDVDSYGKCLHNKDFPEGLKDSTEYENDEFVDFISQYKFHLAFENAVCKDYMTEKLMRTLHVGSIPIYRGSPSAPLWMPSNNSVIMVDDFANPKELAAFIKKIDENDTEYESYVEYKVKGITNDLLRAHLRSRTWHKHSTETTGGIEDISGFECNVCNKLHERINNEKAREENPSVPLLPPKMANGSHMGCPIPYPSIGNLKKGFNHTTNLASWIATYWGAFDRAQAIRDMIMANETDSRNFPHYLNNYYTNTRTTGLETNEHTEF